MGIAGVLAMLGLGYLLSSDRAAISRRTVLVALALQTAIAALVLYVPQGSQALDAAVRGVQHFIDYAKDGIRFVFGENFEENLGFTVALNVLPVIVFIGAVMSVLYYLGIMQRVVGTLGGWLHKLLGTSQPESISAVAAATTAANSWTRPITCVSCTTTAPWRCTLTLTSPVSTSGRARACAQASRSLDRATPASARDRTCTSQCSRTSACA